MDEKKKVEREKKKEDRYEVFIDDRIPRPKFVLSAAGLGCCPRGDIIAIKAKSKNGKTFLSTLFAAVILGAEMPFLQGLYPEDSQVLYFDTEQNKINSQMLMNRIYTICEWDFTANDRLHVFSLREMSPEERIAYILDKTNKYKPTAIFIDGLADLLHDFNDIAESNDLIGKLMKLSTTCKCAVFFILHTNKGKEDSAMKGHLGTMAWQKCSDVFNVERQDNGLFSVIESDCRNKPIQSFEFKVSEDGIPFIPKSSKYK